MPFRPGKSLLPIIMREKGLEPVDIYNRPTVQMSKQQFSDYYTSRTKMSAPTLKMFSVELGVPMESLCEWEYYDPKPRPRKRESRQQTE